MNVIRLALAASIVTAASLLNAAEPAAPAPSPLNPTLPSLFIAGDSTAAKNDANPIQGWGVPFADYFDPAKVNVVNLARGGRSSRTFITEGLWDALLAQVKPGDVVLIQFGHNDAGALNDEPPPPLRARGTIPGLGEETKEIDNVLTKKHEVVHTFGWYIRQMIGDVKARKATPIVMSLTVRNIWHDGHVERGAGHYREWDRQLAHAASVEFVDVTRIIADQYEAMGESKAKEFFPKDHTHTNAAGADFNAASVVAGLKGLPKNPYAAWFSAKGTAVTADPIGWLNLPEPADPKLPTLLFIGDSTVRNGRGDGVGGQWGWGDFVAPWFKADRLNVVNRAIGGLSSRTFLTQGHWQRALALLKPGDWVLMQFGHNDDGPLNDTTRARGTIKGIGEESEAIDNLLTHQHEIVHTYGWYLRQYIHDCRARGITPVMCTPIPRKVWKDGHIVRSDNSYAGWARAVAKAEGVAVIDLNEQIAAYYDQLGATAVDAMFADAHTHTSEAGAKENARIVVAGLRALPGDPLAADAAK
ncbi:MAG TPA: rhamnogalacturonan acetylesterase [Candidatus Didemnitutus sp.]|nr:rhamnogalacturonan acetylesterase [Candidatus Didemnitutus sp.]